MDRAIRVDEVQSSAREANAPIGDESARLLARYLDLVRGPGMKIRVISKATRASLLRRHLTDSLVGVGILDGLVPEVGEPIVLDIGSGGGFPGMVTGVARPRWQVHLAESNSRRAGFLLSVVERLGLANVRVRPGRAEEAEIRGSLVTARAVAPLDDLLPVALRCVIPGGYLVFWKGASAARELEKAGPVMDGLGLTVRSRHRYYLPGEEISREIIVLGVEG
ncbi:MAG: 16S rRNA (guanine(527)-N(7))-methyltransferase RsmG [Bacillota bacterium]